MAITASLGRALPPARVNAPSPAHAPELERLVELARAGDTRAIEALVRRYAGLVGAVTRGFRLSPADAEDVAQTTWLRLVERLGQLREPGALPGWVSTTARRESLRILQGATREVLAGEVPEPQGDHASPETSVTTYERRQVVARALSALPDRDRRLLRLLFAEPAMSYEAISASMAMPIGSIGPTRARCLARLRRDPQLAGLAADA